tara:strand:- start:1683 stop:2372 length:690 start_codon:yes stop_codon:yes gene_type:complete
MSGNILIIEDDSDAASLIKLYLQNDGYKVTHSADGFEGLRLSKMINPDLIILDLMLPGLDGIEICKNLREDSDVPIIMLTARADENARLEGLGVGADDYVTKPFSPRELIARVETVLRRSSPDHGNRKRTLLKFRAVTLDTGARMAFVDDINIQATPTELKILELLMSKPDVTFTRDQIIEHVFDFEFDGYDRNVDTHVANLRKKIQSTGNKNRYLHTIYGTGYRFGDA